MKGNNPQWWNGEHDSTWENVKTAFRRDWEQTKHDFGSDTAADLQQSASDTIKQAAGKQHPVRDFDSVEPAFRYALGARAHHQAKPWNDELETELSTDYPGDWKADRDYVRHGYHYRAPSSHQH